MLLSQCPHCQVNHVQTTEQITQPEFTPAKAVVVVGCPPNEALHRRWRIVRCQNPVCGGLVLVILDYNGKEVQIYPFGSWELDKAIDIKDEIRCDFKEAGIALAAGCYKASMVMSRRVLQRCLKEQGCNQRQLVDAISHAIKEDILRKPLHDIATEIREYGNLGAHPDDDGLAAATQEAAKQILEFARLVVHEFYEVPAAAEKLKKNRQAGVTATPPKAPKTIG